MSRRLAALAAWFRRLLRRPPPPRPRDHRLLRPRTYQGPSPDPMMIRALTDEERAEPPARWRRPAGSYTHPWLARHGPGRRWP